MLELLIYAAAGFVSGAVGALGLGGGGILIVILTAFMGIEQTQAQFTNLMFFIPVACLSVIIYSRKGSIRVRPVAYTAVFGLVGAVIGVLLLGLIGGDLVGKLFAALLIIISVREWFS